MSDNVKSIEVHIGTDQVSAQIKIKSQDGNIDVANALRSVLKQAGLSETLAGRVDPNGNFVANGDVWVRDGQSAARRVEDINGTKVESDNATISVTQKATSG